MRMKTFFVGAVMLIGLTGLVPSASAQDNIGGHIGFVLPLVTRANGVTTTLSDRFTIGFPIGVTFKGGSFNLDLEMVPGITASKDGQPQVVSLTVDPGVVCDLGGGVAAGLRVAFDVNSSQWGFIPLLNKSWKLKNQSGFFKAWFVEADLPIKFNRPGGSGAADSTPVTFAAHFGLGF